MARYFVSWNVICTHCQQLGRPDNYIGTIHSSAVVTSGHEVIEESVGGLSIKAQIDKLGQHVLGGIAPQHQHSKEYHIFQVLVFTPLQDLS